MFRHTPLSIVYIALFLTLTECQSFSFPNLSVSSATSLETTSSESFSSSSSSFDSISSVVDSTSSLSSFDSLSSSSSAAGPSSLLKVLMINDYHGALEVDANGDKGIARISHWMKTEKAKSEQDTLLLATGDMFQGTAVSNYYRGRPVIEAMNTIGFDAMTIGNHEFDWGIETLLAYQDGNLANGEAQFPFLSANIFERATDTPVTWAQPYTIVTRGFLRIGIIGVIGPTLTDSIATSISAPYQFKNPVPLVAQYATYLRSTEAVDVVFASIHDANDSVNSQLAGLAGLERIDGIMNAHSHQSYTKTLSGSNGRTVPAIQSGSSGSYVGELVYKINDQHPTFQSQRNIAMTSTLRQDPILTDQLNAVLEEIGPIINEVIGTAGEYVTRDIGAYWAADVIRQAFDVDVAMVNIGGIRSSGFPVNANQDVTIAMITLMMPFDNYVKIVTLTGTQLYGIFTNDQDGLYTDLMTSKNGTSIKIQGQPLNMMSTYRVATVDYIFDKTYYPFVEGTNIVNTGVLLRDLMILDVRQATTNQQVWKPSLGAILPVQS